MHAAPAHYAPHASAARRSASTTGFVLRRACACGAGKAGGTCGDCERKRALQRHAEPAAAAHGHAPPSVHQALASPGRPLDAATRRSMEPRFGHSFADVRVHDDARAAGSARAVHALAYTVGRDVVFGAGQYAPHRAEGRRLLAHELAHVVQQSRAGAAGTAPQARLEVGPTDAPEEREADRAADAVMRGERADAATLGAAPARIARSEDAGTPPSTPDAGTPLQSEAPSCPVSKKGTLSKVSWGETGGLYPTTDGSASILYNPSKWDPAKVCEILRMRRAVQEVAKRGQSVHESSPPASDKFAQSIKHYHHEENFGPLDAEIADPAVKWFYLSPSATATHTGVPTAVRVKSYGTFWNVGGGDVKKGLTYIHFYKLPPPPAPAPKGDAGAK